MHLCGENRHGTATQKTVDTIGMGTNKNGSGVACEVTEDWNLESAFSVIGESRIEVAVLRDWDFKPNQGIRAFFSA